MDEENRTVDILSFWNAARGPDANDLYRATNDKLPDAIGSLSCFWYVEVVLSSKLAVSFSGYVTWQS